MQNFRSRNPFSGSAMSMSNPTSTFAGPGTEYTGQSSITRSGAFDTSSTTTLVNHNNDQSIDSETSALIASLLYDDLQEIFSQRKGKSRQGGQLNDAEYALQMQSEQLEGMLNEIQDAEIARRMQDAMRLDQAVITEMLLSERVAQQDHEAALALSRGHELPRKTKEQMAVERGMRDEGVLSTDMFEALSPKLRPTPASALGKGKEKVAAPSPHLPSISLPGSSFGLYRAQVERPHCVGCDDRIPVGKLSLKAPCDHHYCVECLTNLVRAATSDESLFPVRCCRKKIPTEMLSRFLSNAVLTAFRAKANEFGTPANQRVYCFVPTCSAFLGSAEEAKQGQQHYFFNWGTPNPPTNLLCGKCSIETCVDCRQRAHPNDNCQQNNAANQVKELAQAQGWQTCPSCKRIIELSVGCNHMTCWCGYEFCYECAAQWKTCECAQWEERRLYGTAVARVERDMGVEARVERPIDWAREVHAFAQNLRVNHECYPGHRWSGHGPGRCEECGMYMPLFLKACRDCGLAVCRRCSFNRI